MNPGDTEMACEVCLFPLNTLNGQYLHPAHHIDSGHDPVPVPTSSLDTIHRVCDFCGDPHPLWAFTGEGLALQVLTGDFHSLHGMSENWAACIACTLDITNGRHQAPAERAARRQGQFDDFIYAAAQSMHAQFFAGLRPVRTLITTTPWPNHHIAARDLPRVRDGLTRFLRSNLNLPTATSIPDRRHQLASSLDQARMYWIDDTFTDMAEAAATQLPALTITRDLPPCDDGLLVWSRPTNDQTHTAATWICHNGTVWIDLYRAIGEGLAEQHLQTVRTEVGWLAPVRGQQLHNGQSVDAAAVQPFAVLLSTWLLIAQGAADTDTAAIDKTVRKKYARMQRPAPDVRIVHLRSHHRAAATAAQPTTKRPYTQRVWVTGHWRNQPYGPGRTLRRPVYIHPHLRGPEDAQINLSTTVRVLNNRTEQSP